MTYEEKLALLDAMMAGDEPMRELDYRSPDDAMRAGIRRSRQGDTALQGGARRREMLAGSPRVEKQHVAYMEDLRRRAADLRAYFDRDNPAEWLEAGPQDDGRPLRIPAEMDDRGMPMVEGRYPEVVSMPSADKPRYEPVPYYYFRDRQRVGPKAETQIERMLGMFEQDDDFHNVLRTLRRPGNALP